MTHCVRRSFRYRFYPILEQAEHLSRTFGCVRLVYNMALEARIRAHRGGRPLTCDEGRLALAALMEPPRFVWSRPPPEGVEDRRPVTTDAARDVLAAGSAEGRNAGGADVRPQRESSFRAGDRRRSGTFLPTGEKPSLAW
ncbi:hypothetical protein GCM10010177_44420 [Actinomadura citrea]|nr:hypothetical protein GCM10010177_44420 [Actinomadura citrea]